MDIDLLVEELPEFSLNPGIPPEEFFDRCEIIAQTKGYEIDRRRKYAGPGFDQLNLHLSKEVMVRMVCTPGRAGRLLLDVVARWSTISVSYEEYLRTAKQAYSQLLGDYHAAHKKRLRLGIPRRAPFLDRNNLDCGRIGYAQEKFDSAVQRIAERILALADALDALVQMCEEKKNAKIGAR